LKELEGRKTQDDGPERKSIREAPLSLTRPNRRRVGKEEGKVKEREKGRKAAKPQHQQPD